MCAIPPGYSEPILVSGTDGVGTKWTSGDIQRTPEFERICGVDGDAECVCGVIWYGYAADGAAPAAPTRKLGVQEVLLNVP